MLECEPQKLGSDWASLGSARARINWWSPDFFHQQRFNICTVPPKNHHLQLVSQVPEIKKKNMTGLPSFETTTPPKKKQHSRPSINSAYHMTFLGGLIRIVRKGSGPESPGSRGVIFITWKGFLYHMASYCWWFRNLANQLRLVVYPIILRVLYIPCGAGFLPSTVLAPDSWGGVAFGEVELGFPLDTWTWKCWKKNSANSENSPPRHTEVAKRFAIHVLQYFQTRSAWGTWSYCQKMGSNSAGFKGWMSSWNRKLLNSF